MRSLLARRPLLSFAVLAFAISWWPVPLGGFLPPGPLIAALVVIAARDGRAGLRALGRRLRPRRAHVRWYLAALALPLTVAAAAIVADLALGAPVAGLRGLGTWSTVVGLGALRLVDPLDGPLGEEPGWRGFALPHLLEGHAPLRATLVLAAIVTAWHVPLLVLPGEALPPVDLLATAAVTVVYSWLWLRTDGDTFTTLVAHAGEGAVRLGALGFAGAAATQLPYLYTAGWLLAAAAVLCLDRRRWLAAPRPAEAVAAERSLAVAA